MISSINGGSGISSNLTSQAMLDQNLPWDTLNCVSGKQFSVGLTGLLTNSKKHQPLPPRSSPVQLSPFSRANRIQDEFWVPTWWTFSYFRDYFKAVLRGLLLLLYFLFQISMYVHQNLRNKCKRVPEIPLNLFKIVTKIRSTEKSL